MAISERLAGYLHDQAVTFDVVAHRHTASSLETAHAAHVSGDRLAKTVVLEDDSGYLLAVLPATCRLDLGELHRRLNRPLGLATESEVARLFEDCEPGAVPAFGAAYGLETVVDERLAEEPDVYVEAGDHERLVHLSGEDFDALLEDASRATFSRHL